MERFNRILCESLAKIIQDVHDWDQHINSVLFVYHTIQQSTTKITPFYLIYGREAQLPINIYNNETQNTNFTIFNRLTQLIDNLSLVYEKAR